MKKYSLSLLMLIFFIVSSCQRDMEKLQLFYDSKNLKELKNWKNEIIEKDQKALSAKDLHNLGVVSYELWKNSQDTLSLLEETERYFLGSLEKREHPDTRYNLEQIQKLLTKLTNTESHSEKSSQEQEQEKDETKDEKRGEEDIQGKENNGEKQETGEENPETSKNENSEENTSGEQAETSSEKTLSGDTSEDSKDTISGIGKQNGVTQSPRDEKYMTQEGEQKEQLKEGEIKKLENIAEKLDQEQQYYQQFFGKNGAENGGDIFEEFFGSQGGDIFEEFFGSQGGVFGDIKTQKEKDW